MLKSHLLIVPARKVSILNQRTTNYEAIHASTGVNLVLHIIFILAYNMT